ncbi:bryoporin-like [Chanos chanos]|uniref:Bryoporin-like n=1 Tax=Chanos chanos TaxID=29144 RepID=A0A6J2UZU5_CHACN|nr:bryoporin-like [Chanos chanos]
MDTLGAASTVVNAGQAVCELSCCTCTIKIKNDSSVYSLVNPKIWMISGHNTQPPPPTVDINTTVVCAFSKNTGVASGAVGVLTYDLVQDKHCTDKMMAIMFSVPFDYNIFKNWLAVGIFDNRLPCDKELYKLMYDKDETTFKRVKAAGSSILYTQNSVEIRATMSSARAAIVMVEIYDMS